MRHIYKEGDFDDSDRALAGVSGIVYSMFLFSKFWVIAQIFAL